MREVTPIDSPIPPAKETREKAMEIGRPLTAKGDRPRKAWGSLLMSLQVSRGLCPKGKCLRKDGHANGCWPT